MIPQLEPTPAEPTPAEPTLAEPTLAEPTLAEPTLAEPTLAEPTLAEPTPAEIFLHLVVTFLTPMFLTATGGDITYARMAATETVNAYGARTYLDLLPIAQVIAFGFAALDSLNRSMNDALSTAVVIRLRANAANLSRTTEQCRRALRMPANVPQTGCQDGRPRAAASPEQTPAETPASQPSLDVLPAAATQPAAPTPTIQAVQPQHAAAISQRTQPATAPAPAVPVATAPAPTVQPTPAQPATATPAHAQPTARAAWATAMNDVAREYTTGLINLPPVERHQVSMRAAALSSVAQHLLSNAPLPPSPLTAPFQLPFRRP